MAGSKYNDTTSIIQVIGCIMRNPSLLNHEGKYFFNEEDFTNEFHKTIFGSMYNLYKTGANNITTKAIEDYLENRPDSLAIYKKAKGSEWLLQTSESADLSNFDYYYQRMKKMTLLRNYDKYGLDVSWIYDPDNILDIKKKRQQENYLDSLSLTEIADLIDDRILSIRSTYIDNATDESVSIGDGIFDLLEELKETPELGSPLYGPYINTITRGCRLKKFYLRSAASGVGKSRTMMADACTLACNQIYDAKSEAWVANGLCQPTLFISTELELSELRTMALAFLANVNEEHILTGEYEFGEWERVYYAAKLLQDSPLYIEVIPDFSLRDIENTIKRNIRVRKCQYVIFDYIHTSMKILEEISQRSGGVKLREDNILFLLSVKLKDICNEFGVFILSGTQLNADWKSSDIPDQNMLRGAKSIADKIDVGMIMLDVTPEDQEAIENIVKSSGCIMPNVKMSIYKNRRGSYNRCYLWMKADKGTCRFNTIFVTDYNYELLYVKDTEINVIKKGENK